MLNINKAGRLRKYKSTSNEKTKAGGWMLTGSLQLDIHVVQDNHAGEKGMHRGKSNEGNLQFEKCECVP